MSSAVFVPVEEYLSTSYEPPCEYVDGQLIQKPMPTWQHGILQVWIASLILKLFPRFVVGGEVRAHLTAHRIPPA
jgi:Uma2 family endonuclease